MLTEGRMPEYLARRSEGVVGILARLIADGAQEAMDSGREMLDENLLDEIVIGREDREEAPAEPAPAPKADATPQRRRKSRNTSFDDHGPDAAAG
jgi:hypothetical protein